MTFDDEQPITDHDITGAMRIYGGSFVKALAQLFWMADSVNQIKLRTAFDGYFVEYRNMLGDHPDILKRVRESQ